MLVMRRTLLEANGLRIEGGAALRRSVRLSVTDSAGRCQASTGRTNITQPSDLDGGLSLMERRNHVTKY